MLPIAAVLLLCLHCAATAHAKEVTLTNKNGAEVHIISTGAVIQRLLVPDKSGRLADVVLGFDDTSAAGPYGDGTSPSFGAVVGRVVNRISGATFELDGKRYKLTANNGPNCIHGGVMNFGRVQWDVMEQGSGNDGHWVTLKYHSKDGEEGFPGNVDVTARYTLSEANELTLEVTAVADAATPINIAQHSYFNLGGHDSGSALGHELTIHGDHYTPMKYPNDVNLYGVPTGEIAPVASTPFDFTTPHRIGERIKEVKAPAPGGYDLNYVLFGLGPQAKAKVKDGMASEEPQLAATLHDPGSGRQLDLYTTTPGLQLYTSNFLNGTVTGKGGTAYVQNAAVCLENQGFPDSINQANFPSVVIRPGQAYRNVVKYAFSAK